MKFYDKRKREFVEFNDSFIEQYEKDYYYPTDKPTSQPSIKGLSRCSCWPEKEIDLILKRGIKKPEDVVHILAWKIGKIKHLECTEENAFKYSSDWGKLNDHKGWTPDNSTVKLRKNQLPIKKIAEYISDPDNLEKWNKLIDANDWFSVLEAFEKEKREKGWKGIGVVYYLTLLYFISKGKYPIFDQFADKALNSIICENEEFFPNAENKTYNTLPSDLPTNEKKKKEFIERYKQYCESIDSLKKKLTNKTYSNQENRSLDRALWVYGHIKCADDIRE